MFRALILTLALAALLLAPPARADFEAGVAALRAGDVATAHAEFLKAAEGGHADAEYNLGLMAAQGQGVEQSDAAAIRWWRRAASPRRFRPPRGFSSSSRPRSRTIF